MRDANFRQHHGPVVDSASNRNENREYFLGGYRRPVRRAGSFTAVMCLLSWKSGSLTFLESSRPVQGLLGYKRSQGWQCVAGNTMYVRQDAFTVHVGTVCVCVCVCVQCASCSVVGTSCCINSARSFTNCNEALLCEAVHTSFIKQWYLI
jgi:hypothetical protein